ncbi:MAG: hypothetical protein IJ867_00080 [Clostridia bacterium]|nr:hypothetical protein [Clostridia bacterium]
MFENVRVLTKEQIDQVEPVLRSFGLRCAGGSFEDGRLYMSLDKGCIATYNGPRIAKLLMDLFLVDTVLLDGLQYERATLRSV